jgi:hypothetical protein
VSSRRRRPATRATSMLFWAMLTKRSLREAAEDAQPLFGT